MQSFVIANEGWIRGLSFFGIFALMAAWELLAPRRALTQSRWARWRANLTLVVLNTLVLRIVFPTATVGMALWTEAQGWGVLPHIGLAPLGATLVAVVMLDLVVYLQHVLVHALPLLWRLHRVHHADLDFDLTTGARFHPLEILFSMGLKFIAILLLGPPVVAVVLFEVILNASSIFNHANVRLPLGLDRGLRWLVVTPDMHRVHHSVEEDETNSNFGFALPWWDRLFGTYRAQPRAGHEAMSIGLLGLQDPALVVRLRGLLLMPFRAVKGYAINRRQWHDE